MARLHASQTSQSTCGRGGDLSVEIREEFDQRRDDIAARADTTARGHAHRWVFMPQERQREVRGKYDAKTRGRDHRRCEVRALHDPLDDHLTNRSRSLRPPNGAKGLQRRDLLGNDAVDAKADETMAKGD